MRREPKKMCATNDRACDFLAGRALHAIFGRLPASSRNVLSDRPLTTRSWYRPTHASVASALGAFALLWVSTAPSQAQFAGMMASPFDPARAGPAYALDAIARSVPADAPLECEQRRLVRYTGQLIPLSRAARVDRAFVPHLLAFERIVQTLGREMYGRAPQRIRHLGAFSCRRIRGLSMWLSEHALGNAIDISGFEFGAIAPSALPAGLRSELNGPFVVTVLQHWARASAADAEHSRFLHELAARLAARVDIFRALIGPKANRHRNHFHFDMGQVRMVEL